MACAWGQGKGIGSGSYQSGAYGSSEPPSLEQGQRACSSFGQSLAERCVQAHLRGVSLERSWGIDQGSFDQEPIAQGLDIPLCYDLVKSP
jgi:hypothetical protein